MKSFRFLTLLVFMLSVLVPAASASAHQPIWGNGGGITSVPNLVTSYAYYRDLPADEVHVYTFEGKTGQELRAGMQIPALIPSHPANPRVSRLYDTVVRTKAAMHRSTLQFFEIHCSHNLTYASPLQIFAGCTSHPA